MQNVNYFIKSKMILITVLIALSAFILRIIDLDVRAIHHDESLHALYSWVFMKEMIYIHDPMTHGPFQFHIIALFYRLFGDSDFVTRLPSAVFGSLLVLTPLLFRRLLGNYGVVFAALFFALSPSLVYYSRFARNDLFIALWTVLIICSILRYREKRNFVWLLVLACSLSFSFATKETTFLTSAIILLYLSFLLTYRLFLSHSEKTVFSTLRVICALIVAPFFWLTTLLMPIKRFRLRTSLSDPDYDLFIIIGTLTATQLAAAIKIPLAWIPIIIPDESMNIFKLSVIALLMIGVLFVGIYWNYRKWLVCFVVFSVTYFLLFTTLLTNLNGIESGLWGSLDYWIDQQEVNRGEQPWFYYIVMLPIYELFLVGIGLFGAAYFVLKKDRDVIFLAWWFLGTFICLTFAGEKMPWLLVHLTVPLVFLTAKMLGSLLDSNIYLLRSSQSTHYVAKLSAPVILIAITIIFMFSVSLRVNFSNTGIPTEPLIYTQTSPDLKLVMNQIEAIHSEKSSPIYIETAAALSWPWAWYLREYDVKYVTGDYFSLIDFSTQPILITNKASVPGSMFEKLQYARRVQYRHRSWFDESGYRSITFDSLLEQAMNGSLILNGIHFLLDQGDESSVGSLYGEAYLPRLN
tara:strand:- start:16078 stop:17976 length:1899 start_codon:yes stop_codon:yes gene_type:complete